MLEVLDQCCDGLIHIVNPRGVCLGNVIVTVPGAGVELHEPNALFHQLAGEQAASGKIIRGLLADTIHCLGLLGFFIDVHNFWHLHLHAESQLVIAHASRQFFVLRMPLGVPVIKLGQEVEITALLSACYPGWWMDIEQW